MKKLIPQSLKILVIDDEQTTKMYSKFFSAKGFEIIVASDPIEGLNLIRSEKFDVILLDIPTSLINGFSIIELLAGEDTLKNQNIFICSVVQIPEVQLKNWLRRDGIREFIKKPVNLDNLFSKITKMA